MHFYGISVTLGYSMISVLLSSVPVLIMFEEHVLGFDFTLSWLLLQLILATKPDQKHGKLPSIVSEDNIQLLFQIQEKVFWLLDSAFWIDFRGVLLWRLSSAFAFFESIWQVDGIIANFSGTPVVLTDICLKPLGQDCATQSVLQVFAYALVLYSSIEACIYHCLIYCVNSISY